MVSWFGDWFHTAINSMHEQSAAQCCLVAHLSTLVLGLACNWPQLCAYSGWDLVAFRDLQGSVTTRCKFGFNGQEMAPLQKQVWHCKLEEVWAGKDVWVEVRSSRGNGGGKLIPVPSLVEGPLGFRWWHSTSLKQPPLVSPCQGAGVIYYPWSTQSLLRLKGRHAHGTKHNNCVRERGGWESVKRSLACLMFIYKTLVHVNWSVLFQLRHRSCGQHGFHRVFPLFLEERPHCAVSWHFAKIHVEALG